MNSHVFTSRRADKARSSSAREARMGIRPTTRAYGERMTQMTTARDLIFVSMEDWDEIWRRNQFVCAELARRHPAMRILFVGLPRNISHDLRQGRFRGQRRTGTYGADGFYNITI